MAITISHCFVLRNTSRYWQNLALLGCVVHFFVYLEVLIASNNGGANRSRGYWRDEMQNEEVLKLKEVATLLKVGEKTVYSMAQSGELPGFKVRGQWRFSRRDLDAWIEQQKHSRQEFREEQKK
jgi:excisionase family DNA binding protein